MSIAADNIAYKLKFLRSCNIYSQLSRCTNNFKHHLEHGNPPVWFCLVCARADAL